MTGNQWYQNLKIVLGPTCELKDTMSSQYLKT